MFRKTIFLLLLVLFALPAIAEPAPKISLELPNLKGEMVSLNNYLGKNTIILSFFASWSKSCQEQILFLNDLDDKYSKKGVKVIGISFDKTLDQLNTFITQNQIGFEILYDKKLKTLKDFRILIIPTLLVIDLEGNVKNTFVDFDNNVKEAVLKELTHI